MTSRAAVRREVATKFLDLIPLTATTDGDTSGVIDEVRLTQEAGYYAGCDLVCVSTVDPDDAKLGHQAYVNGSSKAIAAITVQPNFPTPSKLGDRFELVNLNRIGGTLAEYELWINAAVGMAAEQKIWTRIEKSLGAWTSLDTSEGLTIPREITRAHSITYVDAFGVTRYPERGSPAARDGWWFDAVHRIVRIQGWLRQEMDGCEVTVVGFGSPPPLLDDAAETDISHAYLVAATAVVAAEALSRKGRADIGQNLPQWRRDLDRETRNLRPGAPPTGTVVMW